MKIRRTRHETFLDKIAGLTPWRRLEEPIEAIYPKPGRGRRASPRGLMQRLHRVQLFYNLGGPGVDGPFYEVEWEGRVVGLRRSGVRPDETTNPNLRHLWV